MHKNQKGFAHVLLIFLVLLIAVLGYFIFANSETPSPIREVVENQLNRLESSDVAWEFNQESEAWEVVGNPPPCSNPLVFPSPVDVNLASGIIYPGQIRGTDYKPHGGLRFDALNTNEVDVHAPMDGNLFKAARHLESGEIQYSLYFINNCGVMYKLDHLRELTDKFEQIFGEVPMGVEGDSRTTEIRPVVNVPKGEHIATKVGFEQTKNIFFDFGVYDLRQQNGVVYDSEFRSQHPNINEYGTHAICWLNYLEEPDKTIVKNLPAGGIEGKVSDYCN